MMEEHVLWLLVLPILLLHSDNLSLLISCFSPICSSHAPCSECHGIITVCSVDCSSWAWVICDIIPLGNEGPFCEPRRYFTTNLLLSTGRLTAFLSDDGTGKKPLSVASRYTRVYSGPATSYEATTLLPSTIYFFRVIAENDVGESLPSEETTGTTLALVPDRPPAPQLTTFTSASISVKFEQANMTALQTLPVNTMELQVAEGAGFGGDIAVWHSIYSGSDRSFKLEGLRPVSGYRFRVRSQNTRGWSDWGEVLTVTTSSAPPDPVTSIRIIEKDPVHILLEWDAPNNNGELIRGYVVDLSRGSGRLQRAPEASIAPEFGPWRTVQSGPHLFISLMDGLHIELGEVIQVRIKAVSAVGEAAWSAPFVAWTKPGEDGLPFMPDQVQRPTLSLVSSMGAVVTWNRPDGNGAPIVRFEVEVAPLSDGVCDQYPAIGKPVLGGGECSKLMLDQSVSGGSGDVMGRFMSGCHTLSDPERRTPAGLTCSLDHLDPGSKYMVRVVARNFVGLSYPSPPALLALFDKGHAIPPTPIEPFIAYADTTSVLLRWKAEFVPSTILPGAQDHVTGFDVGIASVSPDKVHQLLSLDVSLRMAKRMALHMSSAVQTSVGPPGSLQPEQQQQRQQQGAENKVDTVLTEGFRLELNKEMQALLQDLEYVHVYRVENGDPALLRYRAAGLSAGGAYALKVRAVDGLVLGDWSDGAFVALSPDVPLADCSLRAQYHSSHHPRGQPGLTCLVHHCGDGCHGWRWWKVLDSQNNRDVWL